jgi:hypothetical protein
MMCSLCMRMEEKWKQNTTGNCQICMPNRQRMNTWTAATHSNPLAEFIKWLLRGVGSGIFRKRRTYAIAHYGG